MNSHVQDPVTSTDRFSLTLFLALVVHAVIILGITFQPDLLNKDTQPQPPLEITLVHQRSETTPDKAEFLAQANLEGGGNSEEQNRPRSPASNPLALPREGQSEQVTLPSAPPRAQVEEQLLTGRQSQQRTRPDDKPPQEIIAPTADELVQLSMEIANLSAEIDKSVQAFSRHLRHRYISARTREYRDAAYLDAWRAKVERIGNLNYPEEAKRRNLSGSLVLDVGLNPDGSVHSITVQHSSGQRILDDAAVRIVRLAAPFAPFPDAMRKDTDVLHIIRSWQFLNENRLSTSR